MVDQEALKNSLWESAAEAFETMVMLPIEQTDQMAGQLDDASLTGSITFMGGLKGVVAMQCTLPSAEKIAKAMLMMEDEDEISEAEVRDAIGEIANLVLGGVKSRMEGTIGELDISVPMVISGQEVRPVIGAGSKKVDAYGKGQDCELRLAIVYKENE